MTDDLEVVPKNTLDKILEMKIRIEKLESALDMSEKRFATLKDAWDTLRRRDMPPLYGSAALAGEKKNDG